MKKKLVKEKLYEIRLAIIEEIEEPEDDIEEFLLKKQGHSMRYGYQVGMSRAAMILLEEIYKMFPEEKEDERAGSE